MKILSESDQIRNKITELTIAIRISDSHKVKLANRINRKSTWGLFSFVFESSSSLERKYIDASNNSSLLEEYFDMLSDRLSKK